MQPTSKKFSPRRAHLERAVFLDRDGVICENRDDYVKSWKEFTFLPRACEAIARLAQSDLHIVIATNQSAINRGLVAKEVVENIHVRMVRAVEAAGGRVDLVTYCPHRPDEECGCRKPGPGMMRAAAEELGLDLEQSYLIGDASSDIRAGQAVGCRCYLVLTGRGRDELSECWGSLRGFRVAADLEMAVEHILHTHGEIGRRRPIAEQGQEWRG